MRLRDFLMFPVGYAGFVLCALLEWLAPDTWHEEEAELEDLDHIGQEQQ